MAPTTETQPRSEAPFPPITVVTGLGFELLAEVGAFTSGPSRAALDAGKTWVRDVRRRAGRELLRRVERFDLGIYLQLAPVALAARPPRGTGELIETLAAMDPIAVQRLLLGGESPMVKSTIGAEVFDRAQGGDAAARDAIRAQFTGDRRSRDQFERILVSPAAETKAELLDILRGWAERVSAGLADDAWPAIRRDADMTRATLGRESPMTVIARATNGIEYVPPSWTTEIVLVPTVALRPFVVSPEYGAMIIFLHPVADAALEGETGGPPRRLVKLAAALGDELRLRILQVLGDDALSAAEIAERLAIDRTTLHHHLGILRSAGLLTLRDERERGWHYVRRPEGMAIAAELDAFVAGSRRSSPRSDRAREPATRGRRRPA